MLETDYANWTLLYEDWQGQLKWNVIHWETYTDALRVAKGMDDVKYIVLLKERGSDLNMD